MERGSILFQRNFRQLNGRVNKAQISLEYQLLLPFITLVFAFLRKERKNLPSYARIDTWQILERASCPDR